MVQTIRYTASVGRLTHRRFLYAVRLLRAHGIDIAAERVLSGPLKCQYVVTFRGSDDEARTVEDMFEQVRN